MTRATEAYTFAAIVVAVYTFLFLGFIPLPQTVQDKVIPVVCCFIRAFLFIYN